MNWRLLFQPRTLWRRGRPRVRGLLRGHRGVSIHGGTRMAGEGVYDLARGSAIRKGARMWVGPGAVLELGPGAKVGIRNIVNVESGLTIGAGSEISWDVQISDTDFHDIVHGDGVQRARTAPVVIGERVLVGARAMILKGVKIGDGAVVGAGSVVVSDVPAGAIVAGNPARVVGRAESWA